MTLWLAACVPAEFSHAAVDAGARAADAVDCDAVLADVRAIVAARATESPITLPDPAFAGLPYTHRAAVELVEQRLAEVGLAPVRDEGTVEGLDFRNVTADVEGGDEVVLVGAHHDAWFSGADDDATGLAALIELGRVLGDQGAGRTVRLAAFDLEEPGVLGSTEWARRHELPWRVLVADSIGFTAPTQGGLLGLDVPRVGDFLAVEADRRSRADLQAALALNAAIGSPVRAVGLVAADGPLLLDVRRADHAPFWAEGVPGLLLNDTSGLRNPGYHTPADVPDALDPMFLCGSVRLLAALTAAEATP